MGMFRDLKGMVGVARSDELKEMRQMAAAQPRTSMMGALRAGNAAMSQATKAQGALNDGIAGQATINSVEATGTLINHTPVLAFDLTVSVPGREPYQVAHTQMISPVAIHAFQPGVTMPVRVAAEDPSSVFLGA